MAKQPKKGNKGQGKNPKDGPKQPVKKGIMDGMEGKTQKKK
jgi:hypothetical protein